jgi:hypothetical protein
MGWWIYLVEMRFIVAIIERRRSMHGLTVLSAVAGVDAWVITMLMMWPKGVKPRDDERRVKD